MKILILAGLPPGVINFVPFSSRYADVVINHPYFAGLHFTGSYETLTKLWKKIGSNVENYKNFPRIVGETGGKDFIFVHNSADVDEIVANIIRGAFESQGQKCSAVSRVYIPRSNWDKIKKRMIEELQKVRYGNIDDFNNFMGAVISEEAFKKYYIEYAKNSDEYEIIYGGNYDDSKEWFVEPTVIISKNANGRLMKEEFFGPVVTVYIYEDEI